MLRSALVFLLAAVSVTRAETPSLAGFLQCVAERRSRVPEFEYLEQKARELGLRLYLFGGTAAAFAHYVRDDQRQEAGDRRYDGRTYDYDFTRIFRATQDLDLVADDFDPDVDDATHLARIEALERLVISDDRLVHFQGSKERWEIRSLRRKIGSKVPLLDNPDYLNQHSDSHSTGLIRLGSGPGAVVRDLKVWEEPYPPFLRDVFDGRGRFYFEKLHRTTSRYLEGKNPPVVAALRFLTKVFQFELSVTDEDRRILEGIFAQFHIRDVRAGEYLQDWLWRNAPKLYQNAVDVELARRELDRFRIREKLRAVGGNPETVGTLAWWMGKEPLWSRPLGKPKLFGRSTARSLGIDIVTHETKSFEVYEAITRSRKNTANVFQSRGQNAKNPNKYAGEAAVLGDGLYTKKGDWGDGSGFPVRFRLHPDAVLGEDFLLEGDIVIVTNRAALTVLPSDRSLRPADFFHWLASKEFTGWRDRGVLERLRRQVRSQALATDDVTVERALQATLAALRGDDYRDKAALYDAWIGFLSPAQQERSLAAFAPQDWERLTTAAPSVAKTALLRVQAAGDGRWNALGSSLARGGYEKTLAAWLSMAGTLGIAQVLGTEDETAAFRLLGRGDVGSEARAALFAAYIARGRESATVRAYAMRELRSVEFLHRDRDERARLTQAWAYSYLSPVDALRDGRKAGFLDEWIGSSKTVSPTTLGFPQGDIDSTTARALGLTDPELVFVYGLAMDGSRTRAAYATGLSQAAGVEDVLSLARALGSRGGPGDRTTEATLRRLEELGATAMDYRQLATVYQEFPSMADAAAVALGAAARAATTAAEWLDVFRQPENEYAWRRALGRNLFDAWRRFPADRPRLRSIFLEWGAGQPYRVRAMAELLTRYDRYVAEPLSWALLEPLPETVYWDFGEDPLVPIAKEIFERIAEIPWNAVEPLCFAKPNLPRSEPFRERVFLRALGETHSFADVGRTYAAATQSGHFPLTEAVLEPLLARLSQFPANTDLARQTMRLFLSFGPETAQDKLLSACAFAAFPTVRSAGDWVALMEPVSVFHFRGGLLSGIPRTAIHRTLHSFEDRRPGPKTIEKVSEWLTGQHYDFNVTLGWLEHAMAGPEGAARARQWMKGHRLWDETSLPVYAEKTFERFVRLEPRPSLFEIGKYLHLLPPKARDAALARVRDRFSEPEFSRLARWSTRKRIPSWCVRHLLGI